MANREANPELTIVTILKFRQFNMRFIQYLKYGFQGRLTPGLPFFIKT